MNVLVATSKMQGQRDNDFNWCDEGELVTLGSECDSQDVDDNCGCRRSLSGIRTFMATTTVQVAKSELSKESYTKTFVETMKIQGWGEISLESMRREIGVLLHVADAYPVGTILERRGNILQPRQKQVDIVQLRMEI